MPATSDDLFDQAEAAFEKGNFEDARNAYREVLLDRLAADLGPTWLSAVALERMADIAYLFGEEEQAEKFLAAIRDDFKLAGHLYGADFISLKIASIATTRGLFRVARATLDGLSARPEDGAHELDPGFQVDRVSQWESNWRWSNTTADDHSIFFASFYLVAGRIAAGEGQYERATVLLKRGLTRTQLGGAAEDAELPLTLCLAAAYLERGDLLSASLALKMLPDTISEACNRGYEVQGLEIQAKLDLLRGNLGPAKQRLERVLEICSSGKFELARARAALNLAYVLIFLNQTARAAGLCELVSEFAVSRQEEALHARAQFLIRFAAERGQSLVPEVAISYSVTEMQDERASPEIVRHDAATLNPFDLPGSPNFLTLFEERALGFYWYLGRSDWTAAGDYLRELEMIFLNSDPPTDSLIIHQRLAALDCMLAYYEGDFESARDGFEKVVDVVRRMDLKPELWQCLRFLEWCHARLGDVAEAERIAREANKINRTLAGTLEGSERAIYQLNKWTQGETYLGGKLNQLAQMKRTIQSARGLARLYGPWRRIKLTVRLAALLEQLDLYKADVMQRTSETGACDLGSVATSKLATLLRLFRRPRGQNTISFLVLPDRTLIARAGWLSIDFALIGVTRLQLRELTSNYHQALKNDRRASASRVLKAISEALQLPALLARIPARTSSLTFVPDDILHGIPFAAIPVSSKISKYLVEDFAVTVSNEWRPKVRQPSTASGVLAVSVPYGTSDLEPLPGADAERKQVLKWLTSMDVAAIESKTEKQAILSRLQEARFFHIACHGEFCPDAPSDSGLLIVSKEGEVNRISLRDLSHLDLSGLELAILSSCWSADNFILPGRWIISLPETFLRAGARTVVGSLWPLDDELAEHFMAKLYEALAAGSSREEALRQVQMACIRGEFGAEFRDPSYWAAVVLHGSTGPLALHSSGVPDSVASGSAKTV